VPERWWLALADLILFHDPRQDAIFHSPPARMALVPAHKSLPEPARSPWLPIGNLSSQFFANIYMNVLDQLVKHRIGARHYVRYVDDFVLLHESPDWLNEALTEIAAFLPSRLNLHLNPKKNYPAAGSARDRLRRPGRQAMAPDSSPAHVQRRLGAYRGRAGRGSVRNRQQLLRAIPAGDSQPSRSVPSGERIASARDDGQCIADQDLSEGCMSALARRTAARA